MEEKLKKVGVNKYQLPKISGMKAEAVVYANKNLLADIGNDRSLRQLQEAASLPNVVSPVIAMPDVHEGFGLPIGGVMATKGLISVGAVGMDINCGVRLLTSNLQYDRQLFSPENLKLLIRLIEQVIPIGLGGQRKAIPRGLNLEKVIEQGVAHLVETGYATTDDLTNTEENGCLEGASFKALTPKAKHRAEKQIGTLGSGNHFIEIQKVVAIFDPKIAQTFGLTENQICLMIHCGSRALGQQTCLDYTNIFWQAGRKYKLNIPHKGLASLLLETPEGRNYFRAMAGCVNFAFCNRQVITEEIRKALKWFFSQKGVDLKLEFLYDVAHNIAKWEIHKGQKLLIHRKGATRALPAGHPQNPPKYLSTGHPAIVPGSMGSASYVMVGLPKNRETFYSINHGAGRTMSRGQAKRTISQASFEKSMGQIVYNKPFRLIADEAPAAYKDIDEVVDTLVEAKLTKKIAKLEPLAVIKGD